MGDQRVVPTQKVVQAKKTEGAILGAIAPKPLCSQPPSLHPMLKLQRQLGNRAVTQMIQTKMTVGKPNDVHEQEADRVADTVMRMPDPPVLRRPEEEQPQTKLIQRQPEEEKPQTKLIQRQPDEETAQTYSLQRQPEEETAQAKESPGAVPTVSPSVESSIQAMRGSGAPLPNDIRHFYESRMGYDLSGVRIHSDASAHEATTHLNAQAFTLGQDIFFRSGYYEPQTTSGKWLLAHELTHTVQQQPKALPTATSSIQTHPTSANVLKAAQKSCSCGSCAGCLQLKSEPPTNIAKTSLGESSIQRKCSCGSCSVCGSSLQTGTILQRQSLAERVLQRSAEPDSALATPQLQRSIPGLQRHTLAISQIPFQAQRNLFGIELPSIDTIRNWAADRAANIPGFTMLTVILGRNPINDRPVERNAVNLIRGALGFIPGGEQVFQALQASGAIAAVTTWLQQQISQLNITWEGIMALLRQAWDAVSITDPWGSVDRVLNVFRPTIDRIRAFASGVGSRVIQFIKEAILRPIGQFAQRLSGYPLLTVILGKDPITDQEVPRNATNVIRGILLILPGGEEKFQNLQRSGIIDRAYNWFNDQLTRLNLTWNYIKSIFSRLWESLSIDDLLSPSTAFERIRTIFSEPVQRITTFAGAAIRKVAEFIFEGVLSLAGGLGQQVLRVFNRARSVVSNIIENPVGFVGNLVNAVKRGFQQFAGNILTHLQAGLVSWLFGALAGAGLQLPERFDLRGIVSLVMQILGLTYQRLRGILVRLLGSEERVQRAEQVFDFLVTLVRDGIAAAWERIVEFAGNLQEMVIGGIRDWVARTVVGQAIARLVTLFNPAGAIIQAIMAIYNTVVFFIERAQQIGALVEAVFESIANIAGGNIGAAANYVERTMARSIPVMLGFLARFIGLGNVGEQIQNVIRRIQAPIENAMNRVAGFIVRQVRGLLGRGGRSDSRTTSGTLNRTQLRSDVDTLTRRRYQTVDEFDAALRQVYLRYRSQGLQSLAVRNVQENPEQPFTITATASPEEPITLVRWRDLFAEGEEPAGAASEFRAGDSTNAMLIVNDRPVTGIVRNDTSRDRHAEGNMVRTPAWQDALNQAYQDATATPPRNITIKLVINRTPCHGRCSPGLARILEMFWSRFENPNQAKRHIQFYLISTGVYETSGELENREAGGPTTDRDLAMLADAGWILQGLQLGERATSRGQILSQSILRMLQRLRTVRESG